MKITAERLEQGHSTSGYFWENDGEALAEVVPGSFCCFKYFSNIKGVDKLRFTSVGCLKRERHRSPHPKRAPTYPLYSQVNLSPLNDPRSKSKLQSVCQM